MSHRLRSQVLVLFLLAWPPALRAQTASLVADLSPGLETSNQSSLPDDLLAFHGKLFFSAMEASSGRELWGSDGEGRGTHLLADFCPGRCDSSPRILGSTATAVVGHTLIDDNFDDLTFLWRSDGTRAGTYLLPSADDPVNLSLDSENGPQVALLGDVLYLSGCNHDQDCGLWRTDGTPAGTRLVAGSDFDGQVNHLAAGSSRLFFVRYPSLWVSDGTTAGTHAVKELPGSVGLITTLGDRALFNTLGTGGELWVSDGTEAGTRTLTSFATPEPFAQTLWLKPMGGKVYFVADDVLHGAEIWVTDGTPAGTRQFTEIGFHNPFNAREPFFEPSGLRITDLELLGDRLVFWATDGLHGFQPWSSRGLPQPTAPLCAGCSFTNDRAALVKAGSHLLFTGLEPMHRAAQVWTTDGTTLGTTFLHAACTEGCDHFVLDPTPFLGSAFFTVVAGARTEMWRSDGTSAGTRLFASPSFGSQRLVALGSTVFYSSGELWASDGTPDGTRLVTDIARGNASTDFDTLTPAGRNLFFATCDGGQRYWYSDGTADGTRRTDAQIGCIGTVDAAAVAGSWLFTRGVFSVTQLWRLSPDGSLEQLTHMADNERISDFAVLGDRLYFAVGSQNGPWALWRSDATVQGTVKLADLPGVDSTASLTAVGSVIWFIGYKPEPERGTTIWRTDGTQAGTRQVADFGRHFFFDPQFTQVGPTLYFTGPDEDDHRQLWRTDGTQAGTVMVRDLDPEGFFARSDISELTAWQGTLYFLANTNDDSPPNRGLFRSDGTEAGTVLVKDFVLGFEHSDDPPPLHLRALASGLVFAASDDAHGFELWRSDGTAAGTGLLRDIHPGPAGSGIEGFEVAGGRVFFSAGDGAHGFELWQTDGTAAGTRMVQDLAPEGASSYPRALTAADDRLFFTADDGSTGEELWVLPLTGPPCQPSATALCLAGGRFEVKASWRDFAGRTGSGHAAPLSADTGTFWFFDPANVETILKVLDGTTLNEHFWIFYGALSNVEYTLTVTDTRTGLARRYFNPSGTFASVGDTQGFGPLGAYSTKSVATGGPPPIVTERVDAAAATGTCVPAAGRLCLNGSRFAVEASWEDFIGRTGTGTAVSLTSDTGYFWFFDAANVEAVIKVLDGTPLNGHFWVYYGALSNVQYQLTVTDTATGAVKTYLNPKGRFASVGDVGAFASQGGSSQP